MFGCPRCGNDAVYLADEVFSLLRCEFCGDDLDADVLLQDVDRITSGLLPASRGSCCPRWKQRLSEPLSAGASVFQQCLPAGERLTAGPAWPDDPQRGGPSSLARSRGWARLRRGW